MFGRSAAGGRARVSPTRRRATVAFTSLLALALIAAPANTASAGKRHARDTHKVLRPAAATGALGLDLMRASAPGNLVLSPDSVAAALAMAGMGGVGSTAREIAGTLHLRGPIAFPAVGALQLAIAAQQTAAMADDPDPPVLEIANGLFLQQGLPLGPAYLSDLGQRFGVAPQAVDFAGDPNGAVDAINGWVSERTKGVIPQVLDSLPSGTALALTNAVYLKAAWRHPFKRADTEPGTFFRPGEPTTAEFMHQAESLRYGSGEGYKAVELPYRSSTLSLLVVLPVRQRLGSLQHRLDAEGLNRIARHLTRRSVNLSLPRFHLNTQADLADALKRLGMPTPFSSAADFSRITKAAPLMIDFVKHAADLTVDEVGTVAAAATVVGFVRSAQRPPRDAIEFNANRPFLFFLRDTRTGAVLFAGRVVDPASAGL